MGAVGTSADNALVESFNASLKRETLQGAHAWPDPATCRRAVFGWVNRYNTHRRHSYCGQQAPIVYEQQLESFPATEASHQRQLHQGRCRRREWLERGLRCPKLVCPPCRMTCRFQDVEEVGCRTRVFRQTG
jgi:hypothetical protein